MKVDCDIELNNEAAAVSLTEMDTQKDMTDEDVMHHLDVIENIELDPETFGMQSAERDAESESSTQEKKQNDDVTIVDEVEVKWYENKVILLNFFLINSIKNYMKKCDI